MTAAKSRTPTDVERYIFNKKHQLKWLNGCLAWWLLFIPLLSGIGEPAWYSPVSKSIT